MVMKQGKVDADLITGIVTEYGVARYPYTESLAKIRKY